MAVERLRIARELHDLVSHHLSVVVVQAQAGQRVIDHDLPAARQVLTAVETSGREALQEMRTLLGVIRGLDTIPGVEPTESIGRSGPGSGAGLAPQPGLADLPGLLAQLRAAGLAVTLVVDGPACPLPGPVEVSAYRIVQEGLTNVLKHAHATCAEVRLRYLPDGVGGWCDHPGTKWGPRLGRDA